MTAPAWVAALDNEPVVRHGFIQWIDRQISILHKQAAEDAETWDAVLVARGAIKQLRSLQRLLEQEERESNVRRKYDERSGRSDDRPTA
jgi:hypothetical protein